MHTYKYDSEPYHKLNHFGKVLAETPLDFSSNLVLHSIAKINISQYYIQDYAFNLHPDLEDAMRIKDFFLKNSRSLLVNDIDTFFGKIIRKLF